MQTQERTRKCFNCDRWMVQTGERFWECEHCGDIYDEDFIPDPDLPQMAVDVSPICLACGQVMEWNGEYRCFDVDLIDVDEEIYECRNPDCNTEDDL